MTDTFIKNNRIALLAPTRARPEWALRFADSVLQTTARPERVEVLFYIDDNDPRLYEYRYHFQARGPQYKAFGLCHVRIGEPFGILRAQNLMALESKADVVVTASDDQVYRDAGWDLRLDQEVAKYPDEIFCMWFNDGHYRDQLCTFPIVSKRWCQTLGYIFPPIFERLYADQHVMDVARKLNRLHYIGDVLTEHLHWSYGKSPIDATFEQQVEPSGKLKPVVWRDKFLFDVTNHYREADARKLALVMNGV